MKLTRVLVEESQMPFSRRTFLGGAAAGVVGSGMAGLARGAEEGSGGTTPAAASQPAYSEQAHTDALFANVPRRFAFSAKTSTELGDWQAAFRPRLQELLGLTVMAREVPFRYRAERLESVRLEGYTREKWHLWTEPNVPLPIWVLIPDKPAARPYPLIISVHGHNVPEIYIGLARNEEERKKITEGDRDIAVQAVQQGYLCVHLTTRGFGETMRPDDRKAKKICSCRTALLHGIMFGRTMIGYRVWDVSRVLDWITRQHPVDAARIAITGNSSGGTTSLFAAACEPRIRVSVPSCYFCTFHASIGSIHHCECNYVPGLLREAEMYDVAGLIAPRPLLAIAGLTDDIFPVAAVRESHRRLREIYRVAGVEDRCELFVGDGGHRYYKQASWPFVKKWFNRPVES